MAKNLLNIMYFLGVVTNEDVNSGKIMSLSINVFIRLNTSCFHLCVFLSSYKKLTMNNKDKTLRANDCQK